MKNKTNEKTGKHTLFDIVLLSLSAVAMIIGVHQSVNYGFGASYWLYMIAIGLFLYYQFRKLKKKQQEQQPKLNRRAKRYMQRHD